MENQAKESAERGRGLIGSGLSGGASATERDPWAHRSQGMRCSTCMWFVAKALPPGPAKEGSRGMLGRCRRHAPSANGFVPVFQVDWCGDHRLDETKI